MEAIMESKRESRPVVTVLGSGTCVPSLKRSSCSVFIKTEEAGLLFDMGAGTMRRLLEAGYSPYDVTHLFFSHLHPDHTGELVPYLFSLKYPGNIDVVRPVQVFAGMGFLDFYKGLKGVYGEWVVPAPGVLTIREQDTGGLHRYDAELFTLETVPVNHRDESIAFRVTFPGGAVFVYSGDTDVSENLVEIAGGADLFVCESAMPDAMKVPGHLTPSIAGDIARRAGVKKLVLTHLYPECEKVDIAKECRSNYDGELVLAEDLMRITI